MLSILIIASLTYGFLNGFHDSSNIVATVISSRALRPRSALLLTAIVISFGSYALLLGFIAVMSRRFRTVDSDEMDALKG